jgi:hypothetical protein
MKIMVNEANKHSWCVNAHHSMSANNDGTTKMCCMVKGHYNQLSNTDHYYIGQLPILDNFNNTIAQKIRNNLDNGIRDDACTRCWQEENAGRKSKRLRDNERYEHELRWNSLKPYKGLAKFELNLGNNCNIKCRTCGPAISSTWMKETYDLDYSQKITFKQFSQEYKKFHQQFDEDSSFWPDLENNLENIKQFDFYGGEPFLSKKMWDILRICIEKGYSKDIELHYNTNGTNWPVIINELWPNFKSINLSFSIDGVRDQFEYMRFPAKWDDVCANMINAKEYHNKYGNMSKSWCITLSTINIYYVPEILTEYYSNWEDFGGYLNLVHGPIHYNISKLPNELKDPIIEKLKTMPKGNESIDLQLEGIVGFIKNGNYNEKIWNNFKNLIKKHDSYRNQNFYETFKEYATLVGN